MGLLSILKEKFAKKKEISTNKYVKGLSKSRKNFADKLKKLSNKYNQVNKEYFEELEQLLIEADVGVGLTLHVIDELLNESKQKHIHNPDQINEMLIDKMYVEYATKGDDIQNDISFVQDGVTVLLVSGVNGVGKTTTIAKIAYRYLHQGKKVMLAAADTFRAGAVEQLSVWANRIGVDIVAGQESEDPSSVAYKAAEKAKRGQIDLLIIDTAGRLQTKNNLMLELSKISRVLGKEIPGAPHESFLVIDATTGQNGVLQAKSFAEASKITGIVVSKMDGTSKGGIILSIRNELGIPVRFIGLGEKIDDLEEFDLEKYLYGLCLGE
ncbi:MAG: signal recognition particle-docking protein FtsY [Bacilli bacterium]|jgi:fused signal recognition particle receptor